MHNNLPAHLSTARTVQVDEAALYALIRRAGYLSQAVGMDWGTEEHAREGYLAVHAEGTREALGQVREVLVAADPRVADDGLWCKIGL